MSRLDEIRDRLDLATATPWPEPWGMEEDIKGDGHWDNEFLVNTENGEGANVATFPYRYHAELFAHAPSDLRGLLAVAEAARRYRDRFIDTTFAPDDIETAELLDALARLDAAEVSA